MNVLLAQGAANATQSNGGLFWGVLLLGVTIALLVLEIFVPSGGLVGVLAGIAAIGSIVAFLQYDTTWGLVAVAGYVILTPIVGVFVFKLWLNSPMARRMILGGDEHTLDPEAAPEQVAEQLRLDRLAQLRDLIGASGIAITALRPVGTVKINGQRIDAMAEFGVIDAGTPIIVTEVYDNQIKVRPA
jgi:membrane-bound ClpP family serine protease